MKLINWLTTAVEQWRQRTDDMQYKSGYEWAHQEFYNNGVGLICIMKDFAPVQTSFDRGVMQAVIDLEKRQEMLKADDEIEFNASGDPIGVPFFIHQSNLQ